MDKEKILKLSEKNKYSPDTSIEEIKKNLEKKYNISYGKYSHGELKKAIVDSSPFFIQNNLIIGFDPTDNKFISDKKEKISIERLVKAVIVEDEKNFDEPLSDNSEAVPSPRIDNRDPFIIMGKQDWPKDSIDEHINRFNMIFGNLKVGELFLPPHSVIVNFLEPTEEQKRKKIVSMVLFNNINIYDDREYIDNIMHEIGHIFWRDCVKFEERKKFYEHFKLLRPGAIYEFEWEKSSEEEVFCTVYKWYLKSLLISKSFYNILAFEDEKGLELLEQIFDRKRKETIVKDMWSLRKEQLFEYLQPKFDRTSGKFILRKGLFDEIKDIEVPEEVQAEALDKYESGHKWIKLGKAAVPVVNGRIDWEEMEKTKANHKYRSKKPDGKGGWIYDYGDDVKKKSKGIEEKDIEEFGKQKAKQIQKDINEIRIKEVEHSIVYDKNGKSFFNNIGTKQGIDFTDEEIKKISNSRLLIHNHPSGDSFSTKDINLLIRANLYELRVYSIKDKKDKNYSLKLKKDIPEQLKYSIVNFHYKIWQINVSYNVNAHQTMLEFINRYGDYFQYEKF